MGQEIERKFLVADDGWRAAARSSRRIVQGYLCLSGRMSIRVRILDDKEAVLTLKSARSGAARDEFEYGIPLEDARLLLEQRSGEAIEKVRHIVPHQGQCWEVDVFEGAHAGLVVAELELDDADETVHRPAWLGREVTDEQAYYNTALAQNGLPSIR